MNPFEFPDFYSFPPFFTLQPVLSTRKNQLRLWREFILQYHTFYKLKVLIVHDCPLWSNNAIDRRLNAEAIQVIVEDVIQSGYGEWEDPNTKTRCRILSRKPQELASDIYEWAISHGYVNSVCTLYELHSGDDVRDATFCGLDAVLIHRALTILEEQGKCAIFQGNSSSHDDVGVKFLE